MQLIEYLTDCGSETTFVQFVWGVVYGVFDIN